GNIVGPADLGANLHVYPQGQSLPMSFLRQDWSDDYSAPLCLRTAGLSCDAYVLDFGGNGRVAVALIGMRPNQGVYANGLFEQNTDGVWRQVGRLDASWSCDG